MAATYNLAFNAAQLVREGVGCALVLDKLITTGPGTGLVFRPMVPPVISTIDFAWKRDQTHSTAAKLFAEEMKEEAAPAEG